MEMKLFDSELKVMDTLWKAGGDLPAGQIAKILQEKLTIHVWLLIPLSLFAVLYS